jgi:glycerol-3-phosphate O-acyltransferase
MLIDPVTLPMWQIALLVVLSVILLLEKLFIPSVRWMVTRKVNRVITEINEHLQIGIRPFQLTKRKVLIDRLVFDSKVIEAMEAYAKSNHMPREVAQEEIRRYAREIVPAFNAYVYYRFIYRLCRFVCRQLYRIRVGVADQEEIRAIDKDATVVFVMNHRSNVDYMLVAYLASRQTTLSYAAGEWAKVFLLQSLIRAMGAFFVRRDSGNPLYRKVLERYVHMASREGVCQAVFPEGGLTKTGALAPPKLGFLDYMLRGYDVDKDRDIIFIPVGINYDKVLEDNVQIKAAKGNREKRSAWHWVKVVVRFIAVHFSVSKERRRDFFGYASVNFGHVISAKMFAEQNNINFISLGKDTRFGHTAKLAEKLMNGIGYVTPVLPVPLIAQVFRQRNAISLTEIEIISAVHELIDELIEKGAPLNAAEIPAKKTLLNALAQMTHYSMLESTDDGYCIVDSSSDLLAYYAASIAHWFDGVDHIDPQQHRLAT